MIWSIARVWRRLRRMSEEFVNPEPPRGQPAVPYKGTPALIICMTPSAGGELCELEGRLFEAKVAVGDTLDPATSRYLWGSVKGPHEALAPPYGPVDYGKNHTRICGVPVQLAVLEVQRLSTAHHFHRTSDGGHKLYLAESTADGWFVYAQITQERILTPAEADLIAEFELLCEELTGLVEDGILSITPFSPGVLQDPVRLTTKLGEPFRFRIGCAGCSHRAVVGSIGTSRLRFDASLPGSGRFVWICPTSHSGDEDWMVYRPTAGTELPEGYVWSVIQGHHRIHPGDLAVALNELTINFVALILDPAHVHDVWAPEYLKPRREVS